MLLGFGAFAELPFSYSGTEGNVTVTAEKNRLVITIGPVGQEVSSVSQTSGADPLVLGTGSVTLSGNANVTPDKVPLVLTTKESGVITWNEIIPGATMVWTPIDPY